MEVNFIQIEAEFIQQIFHSDESNYYIIRVKMLQSVENYAVGETLTVTGNFIDLAVNHQYCFSGNFTEHPKYGYQFQAVSMHEIMPKEKDNVVHYIKNLKIKGIGIKTIEQLYDHLGSNMLEQIATGDLEIFTDFSANRWNSEKAALLQMAIKGEQVVQTYFFELIKYGFPSHIVSQLHEHYREDLQIIVQTNCYQILDDFDGISIKVIDKIVEQHFPQQQIHRIGYAITYYIKKLCYQTGNSVITKEMIMAEMAKDSYGTTVNEDFSSALAKLITLKKVYEFDTGYALDFFYYTEKQVSLQLLLLKERNQQEHQYAHHIENYIGQCEERFGITYDEHQKAAMNQAFTDAVFLITGGPGTGKTTIIRAVLEIYMLLEKTKGLSDEQIENHIALLAPTGRAAQRMQDATHFSARTIHSFLGWDKHNNSYRYNDENPMSDIQFVIVDEASMIDIWLANALLKALPNLKHIIIVGDKNQLPSVSTGQFFSDSLASNTFSMLPLKKIFRQKENSTIIDVAAAINEGVVSDIYFQQSADYSFLELRPQQLLQALEKICLNATKKGYNVNQIQILAPLYKSQVGIDTINSHLQKFFNPDTYEADERFWQNEKVSFLPNDKIIQLKNMPELDVYNGDIGRIDSIEKITEKTYEIVIDFNGNYVIYTQEEMKLIRHAYCISVHKSQGSEFPIIIMPIFHQYSIMLYRQLLYTGASRAKHSLVILGQKQSLIEAIKNNHQNQRITLLKSFLTTEEFDNSDPETITEALNLGVIGEQLEGVEPYDFL
ncbi:MAG: SF1B family DNA helicase RecD2 [Culicoidibacterales bacterium]